MRVGVLVITLVLAGRAFAQPASPLSVARGPGADDCPDAEGLLARVEQIRKSPARVEQPAYGVAFARDEAGIRAEITSAQGSMRLLTDRSADCAALAQATAVTLALLFDADAQALEASATPAIEEQVVAAPAAVKEQVEPAAPIEAEAERSGSAWRSSVALGAGGLLGVTRSIAPALVVELGVSSALFRAGVGGLYAPAIADDFAGGSVRESLAAGSVHACIAAWPGAASHLAWRFDLCAGGWLGSLHASAQGFDQTDDATRFWSALAFDLRLSRVAAPLGAELAAALVIPIRRQDFAIDNVGIAYESSPVALLLTMRAQLAWPW